MSRIPAALSLHCATGWMDGSNTVRARYMVGADGARSSVVEQLDLPIEGRMARAGTVYTIFNADLSRYSKHRPAS